MVVHAPEEFQARLRRSFPMLHPVAAPESSASEFVLNHQFVEAVPVALTSIITQYVVLAARSMPLPDAVKVLVPLLTLAGFVSVPVRLVPGLPDESDRMLTV